MRGCPDIAFLDRKEGVIRMEANARVHVIVSGRVQGVFFRDETRRAAEKNGVAGWVRNLPDGTVEALFEGQASAVDAMIQWCHQGSPHSRVVDVQVEKQAYVGDMNDFTIRR